MFSPVYVQATQHHWLLWCRQPAACILQLLMPCGQGHQHHSNRRLEEGATKMTTSERRSLLHWSLSAHERAAYFPKHKSGPFGKIRYMRMRVTAVAESFDVYRSAATRFGSYRWYLQFPRCRKTPGILRLRSSLLINAHGASGF